MELSSLDRVARPIATAQGLPNDCYISQPLFELEREAVFFRTWTAIGFAQDLPEPGDARPLEFLGVPLLLVRDRSGSLRVFQNTCRHRGMILLDKPTRLCGAIRCPYHAWCYGLDGQLRATPHVGGPGCHEHAAIDRETLGLVEIRSAVWRDVVFVNLSGDAPAFADYAADLIARWDSFERPLYRGGADSVFHLDVACNWKLAVENYCESYHLPLVHPALNSYSRLEDHYNILGRGYAGQGTRAYTPQAGEGEGRFHDFPDLADGWREAAEYIALFPNLLLGVHRDHAFAIVLDPLNQARTLEHVAIYYASAEMQAEPWRQRREQAARRWREVFEEDLFVVEGMQRGRRGIKFDGGKFSPIMDAASHAFHAWVAKKLGG